MSVTKGVRWCERRAERAETNPAAYRALTCSSASSSTSPRRELSRSSKEALETFRGGAVKPCAFMKSGVDMERCGTWERDVDMARLDDR